MRKPRLSLFWKAARGFFTLDLTGVGAPDDMQPAPWLHSGFVRRNHAALCGYPSRVKLFGPLPSFQANVITLEVLRRTLEGWPLQPNLLREVRWPYLDRDLLEFLYAIPRAQILGVGKRRFLMRRALVGIVPDVLLNRRRKAFVPLGPEKSLSTEWPSWADIGRHMVSISTGFIDLNRFEEALQKARRNEEVPIDSLKRTLTLEFWLRHLTIHGILANSMFTKRQDASSSFEAKELQAPSSAQKFS
jgi:asparagine synthase (glutamine-hydrolysing)